MILTWLDLKYDLWYWFNGIILIKRANFIPDNQLWSLRFEFSYMFLVEDSASSDNPRTSDDVHSPGKDRYLTADSKDLPASGPSVWARKRSKLHLFQKGV